MVGDNDAGAFGTYTQAGQNYGTTLLWTLMLLIPVLYVNQEMVVRLGTVSGVGHARLILKHHLAQFATFRKSRNEKISRDLIHWGWSIRMIGGRRRPSLTHFFAGKLLHRHAYLY
jgi:hypothetical protein